MTVGLLMVVRNEIKRIGDCLDWHLPFVDEVAIADQQSDDGTWEAIEERKKISTIPFFTWRDKIWGYCEPSKQETADLLQTDWILYLDADEKFPRDFLIKMHKIIEDPTYDGYTFRRDNIFDVKVFDDSVPIEPKWLSVTHPSHDNQLRLTRTKYSVFPPYVHNRVRVRRTDGRLPKIGNLKFHIEHRKTLEEQWQDHARYNTIKK